MTKKPKDVVVDNTTLDKALADNRRRRLIQTVMTSSVMKLTATGFLLAALFSATFIVAFQEVQKRELKDALHEIPEAEVTVPNIVEYANSNLTATPEPNAALSPTTTQSRFCGGIAAIQCPPGFQCRLDGNYPDAGGQCVVEGSEVVDKENPMAP